MPVVTGRPWSSREDALLLELKKNTGYTWKEIATGLNRTQGACQNRYGALIHYKTTTVDNRERVWPTKDNKADGEPIQDLPRDHAITVEHDPLLKRLRMVHG